MFGGMSTQNQPLNQSAQQGGLQIRTLDAIKGTTRFSDLAPDLQNEIQALDNQIQYHISNANKCREIMPQTSERVASLAPDVAYIEQYLNTSELGIDNDSKSVAQLNAVTKKDQEEAALNGRAIENYKLPQQYHYGNRVNPAATKSSPSTDEADDHSKPVDLVTYFSNRTENLSNTLDVYQRQIREIEGHLRHMEAGTVEKAQQLTGSRSGVRDQRRELVDALQAIERAILESAKKVGQTRDLVTQQTMGSVGGSML
jgi:nucleoporin p58/p45